MKKSPRKTLSQVGTINLNGKKYVSVPVGTYVLKSTYAKLKSDFDFLQGIHDQVVDESADIAKEIESKTSKLNNLSGEYNDLVAELNEYKIIGMQYKEECDARDKKIEQYRAEIKHKNEQIFWAYFFLFFTTCTTLLFVGYHIYKTL